MSTELETAADAHAEVPVIGDAEPRCLVYARRGIQTSDDFAGLMSAIISDVLMGKLPPNTANAAINAGGKLLKINEMRLKHGSTSRNPKQIQLVGSDATSIGETTSVE